MTIEEALQNINNYKEVNEDTLNESFKVVISAKLSDEMSEINYLIGKYDLKRKNRSIKYTYKRMYISWYLKDKYNFTFKYIGKVLNRDHSAIVYLVKKHHEMENFNFKFYFEMTKDLRDILKTN